MKKSFIKTGILSILGFFCLTVCLPLYAKETVNVSLFSWPGYGFWFIAREKNLVPELELNITIIEDPYESFGLMNAGKLDVTSSTVEYGPIAADTGQPIRLVAYTNPSYGTDKIILAPAIEKPAQLKGKSVAVMEGGLTQIYMGIWLTENGVSLDEITFTNVIMDDAVAAMVGGTVAGGEFWEPFGSAVLENLPGSRVVASSLEPYWLKTALLGDGMYMNSEFIAKRPDAARMTMEAYFKAVDFWKKNPKEGNAIIARGINFSAADVEAVIGATGKPHKGGIAIFSLEDSARFMGVLPGEPMLDLKNNQIQEHWHLTNTWWEKFGMIKKPQPMENGISLAPLRSLVSTQ